MRSAPAPLPSVSQPPSPQGVGMSASVHGETPSLPLCGEGPNAVRGRGSSYRLGPTSTVARARELRKTMTHQEVRLWLRLRELKPQGFRFRRQVRIERWIADFACFQNRLIVEVDGMQHGFEQGMIKDALRDQFLASQGFVTLRFTNDDVFSNIDSVVETIFLKGRVERSPLPELREQFDPPRKGEGWELYSEKKIS
jgi:very-short-patch-repair endonuclease